MQDRRSITRLDLVDNPTVYVRFKRMSTHCDETLSSVKLYRIERPAPDVLCNKTAKFN